MKIYKTKIYRIDYKGTHGGGVDHYSGRLILAKMPWIIQEAEAGKIELTEC